MLPVLEAEQQLMAIEAVSVPHMNDQTRRSVLDRHSSRLRQKAKSAVEALMEAGIPVRHVPARKAAGQAGTRRKGRRDR